MKKQKEQQKWRIQKYHELLEREGFPPDSSSFANAIGIERNLAYNFAKYHNLKLSKKKFVISEKRREKYQDLIKERVQKYNELCEELDRLPTKGELAKKWEIPVGRATTYINFRRRNYGEDFKTISHGVLRGKQIEFTIRKVIQEIYDRHKLLPSISELALVYGVSKQRIDQIVKKNQIEVRSSRKTIRWNVDPEKYKSRKGGNQ